MTQLRSSSPPKPAPSPLTEEDFLLIRQAGYRRGAVKKVAITSQVSAISILLVAALALPFTLMSPSWVTPLMLIVTAVGVVEYIGHRKVAKGEAKACRMLGINQLVLLGVILLYCVGQIITLDNQIASSGLGSELAGLKGEPMAKGWQNDIVGLAKSAGYALYGSVAVISIACQGGLALYYFRRRQVVAAYNQAVPEWIQRVFREIS